MLSKFELYDTLKREGLKEIDGYLYKDDVAIPFAYDIYLKEGLKNLLHHIERCVDEAALLDRMLENPKGIDLFPVIEDETLSPHIYAHVQGKLISRMRPAHGNIEQALKNLKKRYPPKEWTYKNMTYLTTESPFLAASYILLKKPEDSFVLIPNQSCLIYVKRDKDMSIEGQRTMLAKAMMGSSISLVPPGKRLEIILPPSYGMVNKRKESPRNQREEKGKL